jgi:hypothetical protein
MVFAVAALLVQFQAFAPPVSAITATSITPLVITAASGPGQTSNDEEYLTSTTESSSTRLNLTSVHLNEEISKTHVRTSYTTVALETPQNSQTFSTVRISTEPSKENSIKQAMSLPSRREWFALSIVQHGAAAFDAYTTRQAIGRGDVEDDPLMRPFAHSPAIYAATQVGPVMFDLLARHMQRSEYPLVRRVWWMPQTINAGLSIFAGAHNLSVPGKR